MRTTASLAILLLAVAMIGCSGTGSSPGFTIHTVQVTNLVPHDAPRIGTDGFAGVLGYNGPLATTIPFAYTNDHGYRDVTNVYAPGPWNLARYWSQSCQVVAINKFVPGVGVGDIVPLPCSLQPFWTPTPSDIDVNAPPATITVSGEAAFSVSYRMPTIDFYDETGAIIGSVTAMSVAADGTSVTISTPRFLQTLYNGSYGLVINNINSDYSQSPVAAAAIGIYGNALPPPPPPPPDCGQGSPNPLLCQPGDN